MSRHPTASLDLDEASRKALEFDDLLAWVASFCRSMAGVDRLATAEPSADPGTVRERLEALDEARRCLEEGGALIPGRPAEVRAAIEALRVEGVGLDGKAARDLATVLDTSWEVGARLRKLEADSFPHLRGLGSEIPDLRRESEAVLRGTDGEGRLLDHASAELRRLRLRLTRVGDRLRGMLQRYVKDPRSEALVRDDFVTQRNGRFVIPVRTDAPRAVRGIVHASSSSGATRFVEPLESVELNNELVRLEEEEREEQRRILASWSSAFRSRRAEIERAAEGLARVDSLQARASFARTWSGVTPRVSPHAPLRLEELRHPLLQRRLTEEGGECVPATLELAPADQVLVLSGPNTGGKTVALKAVGLAVLAAQTGIPLLARTAELPLFRQIRADIGDHQSIEADLSTYSAHVRAVAGALRNPRPPALFLFDEIGTGTEPHEGAALARAVLESLLGSGITTLATTHLGPLKVWAVTTEGAACAAMEFDPETLAPSYRIAMGSAGRSAGLEIADRLGMADPVVARARSLLDPGLREAENYLRRLREAVGEAERRAEELGGAEAELAERRLEWEAGAAREAERRQRQADDRLERALEEFRRQAREEVASIREPAQRARAERRRVRSERRIGAARARHRAGLAETEPAEEKGRPVDRDRLAPGDRVWVRSLGRAGELEEVEEGVAAVRLGGMTFRVTIDDLRLPDGEAQGAGRTESRGEVTVSAVAVGIDGGAVTSRELVLVGRRIDEALERLDRFLDAAQVAGHEEVRIVHGHGTGRLRAAVRRFLAGHAAVRSHRAGRDHEGGDGATVATLG